MGGKDLLSYFKEGLRQTSLETIREEFPGDEDPIVGCDVAIWINASLRSLKPAIAQFHSQPNVPIVAVGNYVQERIQQLLDHNFRPVLIFDGQSNPSKGVAHGIRYHALDGKIEELESIYRGEVPRATYQDVLRLQKETVVVRNDVLFQVLAVAKEMKVDVIGSPFEADHMLVSLANQGIIDFVQSNDADLTTCGAPKVITTITKAGNCYLLELDYVLKVRMPKWTASKTTAPHWHIDDLRLLSCLSGNDFVTRRHGYGPGKQKKLFREAFAAHQAPSRRRAYIRDQLAIDAEHSDRNFSVAMELLTNAPVFVLKPHDANISARSAFFSGARQYDICLRAMDGCHGADVGFWLGDDSVHVGYNSRVGFLPFVALYKGWPTDIVPGEKDLYDLASVGPLFKDIFFMERWAREGVPFKGILPSHDGNNFELMHGSFLDLGRIPAKYIGDVALILYLEIRGINSPTDGDEAREQLVNLVERISALVPPLKPMPKCLLRGCGGYVAFEPVTMKGDNVPRLMEDDALDVIIECVPEITDEYFNSIFGRRNSTRVRVIAHVQHGSFDLRELTVTFGLTDTLDTSRNLLVVECLCAPSQRLGSGDMYNVRAIFNLQEDDATFLPNPFSTCACANGGLFCAHLGALLIQLQIIQSCQDEDFAELIKLLPEPIHSVEAEAIPISLAFPPPGSEEKQQDLEVTRAVKRLMEEAEADEEIREEDAEVLSEAIIGLGVPDVADAMTLQVCTATDSWLQGLEKSEKARGRRHKFSAENIAEHSAAKATPNKDPDFLKRQLTVHTNLNSLYESGRLSKNSLSLYLFLSKTQRAAELSRWNEDVAPQPDL